MTEPLVCEVWLAGQHVAVSMDCPATNRRGICDAIEALDEAYNGAKLQLFQRFQEATT